MPAALIHLFCPACGQAFLTHAQHALSVQSCPHCAFTGTAGQFISEDAPATTGLAIRRRQIVRRSAPVASPTTDPQGWEVRTYEPIIPAPIHGATEPLTAPPRREIPGEPPPWETMQAFAAAPSMASSPPAFDPVASEAGAGSSPRMAPWSPMKAPGSRKMTQWQSLDIALSPVDDPGHFIPRRQRSLTGLFIVLSAIVLTGVVAALWLDKKSAARTNAGLRATATEKIEQIKVPVTAPPLETTSTLIQPAPPESLISSEATLARVESLLQSLDAATSTDARLACLAGETRLRDSVEDFFKALASPLQFSKLRALPAVVHAIPGKHPITLCAMEATMPDGKVNGLARLAPAADGSLKLDWNTLRDSLQRRLSNYAKAHQRDPQWITIGMLRNFGFDEPAETREHHHVFDIQGLGDGSDHNVAFAAKDTPIGRNLDDTLGWKQLYIIRALVHWTQVGDQQRLAILDAEMVPESALSR